MIGDILMAALAGLASIVFTFWGIAIGFKNGEEATIKEAVKAGKAEYYLDADNNKQWRWK